jgi:hypothetical protein
MAHERLDREESVQGSSNRSLGIVFAAVFTVVALAPLFSTGKWRPWALIVAALFAVAALAFPSVLAPLNRVWLKLGLLLHRIVSPIVLGIMFFLVITPMGLLMRALGKDPLRLRLDAAVGSYWIPRTPPGPPAESLKDQF